VAERERQKTFDKEMVAVEAKSQGKKEVKSRAKLNVKSRATVNKKSRSKKEKKSRSKKEKKSRAKKEKKNRSKKEKKSRTKLVKSRTKLQKSRGAAVRMDGGMGEHNRQHPKEVASKLAPIDAAPNGAPRDSYLSALSEMQVNTNLDSAVMMYPLPEGDEGEADSEEIPRCTEDRLKKLERLKLMVESQKETIEKAKQLFATLDINGDGSLSVEVCSPTETEITVRYGRLYW